MTGIQGLMRSLFQGSRSKNYDAQGPASMNLAAERTAIVSTGRCLLAATFIIVKIIYMIWFYRTGINLNIGDTATYLESTSAEVFYDRGGGIGFAYVASLLFSNTVSRFLIEILTLGTMAWFILNARTDGQAALFTCLLLLPTSLAFLTVASKELLIFLLLALSYRAARFIQLPAFILVVILKSSFVTIILYPLLHKIKATTAHLIGSVLVIVMLSTFYFWQELYQKGFETFSIHFTVGDLTYRTAGFFPISVILRTLGIEKVGVGFTPLILGISLLSSHLILVYALNKSHGLIIGIASYALLLVAVIPYSVYNLGSAARYQAPLVCAVVLNELLSTRDKQHANRELNK